jgi:hypothetical protein
VVSFITVYVLFYLVCNYNFGCLLLRERYINTSVYSRWLIYTSQFTDSESPSSRRHNIILFFFVVLKSFMKVLCLRMKVNVCSDIYCLFHKCTHSVPAERFSCVQSDTMNLVNLQHWSVVIRSLVNHINIPYLLIHKPHSFLQFSIFFHFLIIWS